MSNTKMFQMVWNKYLPLIIISLKAAIRKNEAQELKLDKYDFEKAGLVKNATYPFMVEFREGHALYNAKLSTIARDFTNALTQDEILKELIRNGHFKFSMGTKFVLTIQKLGVPANLPAPDITPEVVAANIIPQSETETVTASNNTSGI